MITVDFNRISLSPGSRILDIGCGNGRHTAAAYGLSQTRVVGADRNVADLTSAADRLRFHDRLGAHGGGIWMLSAADITRLPFSSNRFDLVICSEVLEHVPDHRRAVSELARVTKPGHPVVVSVPRRIPEWICWKLSRDYANANQGHIRIYEKRQLFDLLAGAGLTPRAVHYAHSLHAPYWWLKCLVGPTREDHPAVALYHRLLTWDIMKKPRLTRFLDRLGNPLLGKSIVVYTRKA